MQIKILTAIKVFFEKMIFVPYYSNPNSNPVIQEELKATREIEETKSKN